MKKDEHDSNSQPTIPAHHRVMPTKNTSDKKRKKAISRFDPFNDRLSRDIRNSLTEAFVTSLKQKNSQPYKQLSRRWLAKGPGLLYNKYIQDRLNSYDRVFDDIRCSHIDDARLQALILWNYRLFFEVHDLLEDIWHKTHGDEYQAIKGLIQAAAVYVHMEYNHRKAMQRLAGKAVILIRNYAHGLGFISNLAVLIKALETLDPVPPVLKHHI
jgi:hypothetical protein